MSNPFDARAIANEANQEDHAWLDAQRRHSHGAAYLSIYDAPNYPHVCWLRERISRRAAAGMAVAEPEPETFRPVDPAIPVVLPESAGKGCGATVVIFLALGALCWWIVGGA
jgi:hypothetical protein